MQKDARVYRYVVAFDGRAIDERRFREVVERNFGVKDVTVSRTDVPAPAGSATEPLAAAAPPAPGSKAGRVLAVLGDGRAWRLAAIKAASGVANANASLDRLVDRGLVSKLRWGLYCKAGAESDAVETPAEAPRSASLRRLHDMLTEPRTAVELKEALGVSRQAVEQKLKRLMEEGWIARAATVEGEAGHHVYHRTDRVPAGALRRRPPSLRPVEARCLSCLTATDAHAVADVADVVGLELMAAARSLRRLADFGLVDLVGTMRSRVARLLSRGIEHPAYDPEAPKAAPFDPVKKASPRTTAVVRMLSALGSATSLELTLLTGIGRGKKAGEAGTGNVVHWLRRAGYLETDVPDAGYGVHRLTKRGLALASALRHGEPIPPEEARRRLESAMTQYRREASERTRAGLASRPSGTHGKADDVLAVVREHGPIATSDVNAKLPTPYGHPRSVDLTLRTLASRGLVVAAPTGGGPGRSVNFWSAVDPAPVKSG